MSALNNPRHERFAQVLAVGGKAVDAYREVYGRSKSGARQNAHQLVRRTDISLRVRELQATAEKGVTLTLNEMHRYCRDLVLTPISQVNADSPLVQMFKASEASSEIRMCDKLKAIELSARLQGLFTEKIAVKPFRDLREQSIDPAKLSPLLAGIARGEVKGGQIEG